MVFKTAVGLISVVLIATVWYISPIMKPFPKPTGPYSVGLKTLALAPAHLADEKQDRTLVIHTFYPADDTAKTMKKAVYLGDKMPYFQNAMAQYLHVPEWVARLLFRGIKIHAVENAPRYEKPFPIVLFSHGLLGVPSDMYTVILEDIASHGYIVLAIDHPGFNELTLYRGGSVVSSRELSAQFQKMSPQEQKEFQSRSIETYKADVKFIIDQLVTNLGDLFSHPHQLDLNRIAVMGHSAGGTAAIEFCRSDARYKAAIDLDGWYDQVIGEKPIGKPLLLMFGSKSLEVSEPTPEYLKRKELTREQYFEREQKISDHRKTLCADTQCQMIVIQGVEHGDFGDAILLKWPLRAWGAADSYVTIRSINQGVIQFLNTNLSH